jgi:hypothetical protein
VGKGRDLLSLIFSWMVLGSYQTNQSINPLVNQSTWYGDGYTIPCYSYQNNTYHAVVLPFPSCSHVGNGNMQPG